MGRGGAIICLESPVSVGCVCKYVSDAVRAEEKERELCVDKREKHIKQETAQDAADH